MPNLTVIATRPTQFLPGDVTFGYQDRSSAKPVMLHVGANTAAWTASLTAGTEFARSVDTQREFAASKVVANDLPESRADVAPLVVWEGIVVKVDEKARVIQVQLDAKIGQMPRHTADIDFGSIAPQDQELVRPGAVFYLTLYKRARPSVENIEELRFRRRPSWSRTQLGRIDKDASEILSKMKALPTAV